MKVVINSRIGGFSLSRKAMERLLELKEPLAIDYVELIWNLEEFDGDEETLEYAKDSSDPCKSDMDRANPNILQVIEELGEEANSQHSTLKIVEIPDGIEWYIYHREDGVESIHEKHRTWH
jgi:hypothetical protein